MPKYDESRAAYRILSPFYGPDDTLYPEDAEIYLDGEPNEEMEPLNDLARERMKAYLAKLDALGYEAAQKAGKAYTGRPKTLDGALEIATAVQRSSMSIFGKPREEGTVTQINRDPIPETGNINPNKRGRGRPRKGALAVDAA